MSRKEYFIEYNGIKEGAFTLEELRQKAVYETALIWKSGWEEWKNVGDVEELSEFIIFLPPPTPNEQVKIKKKVKLNQTLSKAPAKGIKVLGVIIGMFFFFALFGAMGNTNGSYGLGIFGYLIFGVLGFGIYWIIKILKK